MQKIFLLGVAFRLSIRLDNAIALFEAFSDHMRQSPEEDVRMPLLRELQSI